MDKPKLDFSDIEIRAWIKEKLTHYQETPRAGVPRGEELPIPRHKYHAALLMLRYGSKDYPNLLRIAKETKTTYPLVGKWRNERKFQKLVHNLAEEFLATWFEFFIYLSNAADAHSDTKEGDSDRKLIDNIQYLCRFTWGEPLQAGFYQRMMGIMEKADQASTSQVRLVQIMEGWIWSGLSAKRKNSTIDLKKQLLQVCFERLKALAVKAVEDSDKEGASRIIETMRQTAANLSDNYWELVRSKAVRGKVGA